MVSLSKEAAIYLAVRGMRNPSRIDWENAIKVIANSKGQKVNHQKIGAAVMEAQFDFKDGISNEFLARELPPPPEPEPVKKEKDVPRKRKRTSRRK